MAEPTIQNPTWSDAIGPWIVMPIIYRICIWVVCHLMAPAYRACFRFDGFRILIIKYFGNNDSLNPVCPRLLVLLGIGQLIVSWAEVVLFVMGTLNQRYTPGMNVVERSMGVYLALHEFVLLLKTEFIVRPANFSLFAERFTDALTIPQMLLHSRNSWLSLGFVRVYRCLLTYERLENLHSSGAIRFFSQASDISRLTVLTVLRLIAVIVIFAGSIFVLEVLGELPFPGSFTTTPMGDLSFFTMVYWAFETLSTVGYGDFAPKTVLGRTVTIFCMGSGVIFFALESAEFMKLWGMQMHGSGRYVTKPHRNHVLVVGGAVQQIDESILSAFFSELYHPFYRKLWPECVVLVAGQEVVHRMQDFVKTHVSWDARDSVTILHGSSLVHEDLMRCCADSATMVYIIADSSGSSGLDETEEDEQNILRALSVHRDFPKVPARVLLIRTASKILAQNAGIREQRVFAMDEIKSQLLWHTARCMGWSSMLCNLMFTTDATEDGGFRSGSGPESTFAAWRHAYADGASQQFFGFLPDHSYVGLSYKRFVEQAFEEAAVLVVAAQIDGEVVVAPFASLERIEENTVCFAIAPDHYALEGLSQKAEWWVVFYRNRNRKWTEQDDRSRRSGKDIPGSRMGSAALFSEDLAKPLLASAADDGGEVRKRSLDAPPRKKANAKSGGGNFGVLPKHRRMGDKSKNKMAGGNQLMGSQETMKDVLEEGRDDGEVNAGLWEMLEKRAQQIIDDHEASPFAVFLEVESTWKRITLFVKESRQSWLPRLLPLVILCPTLPSVGIVEQLDMQEDRLLGFVKGSPKCQPSLLRAGVPLASMMLCPAIDKMPHGGSENAEQIEMADSNLVILYHKLMRLASPTAALVCELKHLINARLLPSRMMMGRRKRLMTGELEVAWRVHHLAEMSQRRKHSVEQRATLGKSSSNWSLPSSSSGSPNLRQSNASSNPAWRHQASTSELAAPSRHDSMKVGENITHLVAVEADRHRHRSSPRFADMSPVLPEGSMTPRARSPRRRRSTRRQRVLSEATSSASGEDDDLCQCGGQGPRSRAWNALRRLTTRMKHELDYVTPPKQSFGVTLSSNPKFIAGSIFTPGVVGCMLARGSYTPGISEVMMKLINPDMSRQEPLVWHIRVPTSLVGSRYEDLWKWLLNEEGGPVFALGLYRTLMSHEASREIDPPQGYVITNPEKDVELRMEDLVYVLASPAWACKQESEGNLVTCLQQYLTEQSDSPFSRAPSPSIGGLSDASAAASS